MKTSFRIAPYFHYKKNQKQLINLSVVSITKDFTSYSKMKKIRFI